MFKTSSPYTKKQPNTISIINKNDIINNDLTGSLLAISIPAQRIAIAKNKKQATTETVINSKLIKNTFRNTILQYGGRYIRKSISSFDSGSNQLIIESASLDYGPESVNPDNFEILYNGVHIPGIYTVDIVGNDVVITLQQDYIDYDNLTPQSTEINIYGKFK